MKTTITFLVLLLLTSMNASAQSAREIIMHGNAYKARGDIFRAEGRYRLALEKDATLGESHARLGEIYCDRKRMGKAVAHFEKALALGFRESFVFEKLAFSHRMQGDFDKAIDVYRLWIADRPDIPEAYLGLGGLYDAKGMKTEAEEAYRTYREMKTPATRFKKVEGR